MHVALTYCARPVLDHSPTEPGVRCQDSSIRSPESGVRSLEPQKIGVGDGVERRNYVPSRNVYEKKGSESGIENHREHAGGIQAHPGDSLRSKPECA